MLKQIKSAAGLGAGMLLLLTACGNNSGPSLSVGYDAEGHLVTAFPRVVEGAARIHQGDTVTVGSMTACLTKSGTVTIEDVSAVGTTGLEQTGWAIRPNPSWQPSPATGRGQLGVSRRPLARLAFPSTRTIGTQCNSGAEGYEFGVELRKTTSGEATAHAFKVTYVSDGDTKTFTFNLGVKLCNENKSWTGGCHNLKV